jgi:hypothetical protein
MHQNNGFFNMKTILNFQIQILKKIKIDRTSRKKLHQSLPLGRLVT